MSTDDSTSTPKSDRLLVPLQRLLALSATDVTETMQQAAQLVARALDADKVDVFLDDPAGEYLTALGTSKTPMGNKEKAIGLDRLPLAHGGRVVEVYRSGQPYWSGQVHQDSQELTGFKEDLQIQSEMLVPLSIEAKRRGVLLASSNRPDFFTEQDLHFLEAVTNWVGVVLHRAELSEQHAREQTEQAQKLAAEEILTVMAHDLRNYLTPLKGRLDILERRARREEQEVYVRELEAINLLLKRLGGLVTDLLDAERLKQGLFSLHRQPVDLVEIVGEVALIWNMPKHPISVQAPEQLVLTADQDRITQVIENLLSNAFTHAAPDTPVQVTLAQEQRATGLWATIAVSNRGEALSPERLASLFQPFAKGARSQGLGLGLWLAQRIAQAHQGTLTAHMEAGTTIRVILALPFQVKQPEEG